MAVASTSFCKRQWKGSRMLSMLRDFVRTQKLARSESKGVSEDDLKMCIRGCWMGFSLIVPFPAILRRVSGSIIMIKMSTTLPDAKRNQNIDRKPIQWVKIPPRNGPMKVNINAARVSCIIFRITIHDDLLPPNSPMNLALSLEFEISPITAAPILLKSYHSTWKNRMPGHLQIAVRAALPIACTARRTIKAAKLLEYTRPILDPTKTVNVSTKVGRRPSVLHIGIQKKGAIAWKTMKTVTVNSTTAELILNSYIRASQIDDLQCLLYMCFITYRCNCCKCWEIDTSWYWRQDAS